MTFEAFRAARISLAEPSVLPGGWTWETWQPFWYAHLLPQYRAALRIGPMGDVGSGYWPIVVTCADIEYNGSPEAIRALSATLIEVAVASLADWAGRNRPRWGMPT